MKNNLLITIRWFLLFIFFNNIAFSQKDFFITQYTSINGLPQNSVKSLACDSSGFLWMTTEGGLVRFDGRTFKVFNKAAFPQFINDRLFHIYKTKTKKLIVTDTYGGCYLINSGGIEVLKKGALNQNNFMFVKGILPDENFYLHYIIPDFKNQIDTNWMYPPLNIFPNSEKTYLIQTKTGIAYYVNYKIKKELNLSNLNPQRFISIGNNVYFISKNNLFYFIDIFNWKAVLCKINFKELNSRLDLVSEINDVFWDSDSSFSFIRIENYLYKLTVNDLPVNLTSELITDKLPRNCRISSIVFSPGNNFLAVGTDTKGLFIYKEKQFRTLVYNTPEEGTNNAYYLQLSIDSNRIFTDWGREFSWNGGKKSNYPLRNNVFENVFKDKNGCVWYSKLDTLKKINPNTTSNKTIYYKKNDRVFCFYEEGDSIWAATSRGISFIKNDSLHFLYPVNLKNLNTNPLQILRGPDKKIWWSNSTGIFRYNVEKNKIDTLLPLYLQTVRCITSWKGFLEIGTYGSGFYLFKDNRLVSMPLDNNKYLSYVHTFVNDSKGFTWMTTNKGLFKAEFGELEKYFNDTTRKVFYINYGVENGINNPEFNGGVYPSSLILKSGFVSLPSMDGLVWYKPTLIKDVKQDNPIIVDAVYLDDNLANISALKHIPSSVQTIRFDFSTAYWGNEQNLLLEYKLEGYNNQWIMLNEIQNRVSFSNLPSGKYIFHLRKKDGLESNKYKTIDIEFSIEHKFYETVWFLFICLLSLVLLVIVIARLYAFNIEKKNKVLEKSVKQRTLELSIANHDLQQSVSVKDRLISIISHDIITPLRFITVVARKGADKSTQLEKEKLLAVLLDIKNTSEKLHNNAQNILNWIKHQNKKIELNITNVAISALTDDIAEMFKEIVESNNTLVKNTISFDDIIKTDKIILSIILHNIISNASKFTFNGTIELSSGQGEKNYWICVSDSGLGINEHRLKTIQMILQKNLLTPFDPAKEETGSGLGYIIIAELITILKGEVIIESKQGEGTRVTIVLS